MNLVIINVLKQLNNQKLTDDTLIIEGQDLSINDIEANLLL